MSISVKNILRKSVLLLMLVGLFLSSSSPAFAETTIHQTTSNNTILPFVIGGFDYARGGDGASIQYGAYYSKARSSIASNFPNSSIVSFPALTTDAVKGVDLLFLSSTWHNFRAISPLTTNEQTVLLNYIINGGCAIVLADNNNFGGEPTSEIANGSLLSPFDVTISGFIGYEDIISIPKPLESPVTNGNFGISTSFKQNYAGYFIADGKYATRLADNRSGGALDVIYPDALGAGSGPVLMFSDANAFFNEEYVGSITESENLLLNAIHYCYSRSSVDLYTISGQITDSEGKGMPYVEVSAINSGKVNTDENGFFTIIGLPKGNYILEAYKKYYEFHPAQRAVTLSSNSINQNFSGMRIILKYHLPIILH